MRKIKINNLSPKVNNKLFMLMVFFIYFGVFGIVACSDKSDSPEEEPAKPKQDGLGGFVAKTQSSSDLRFNDPSDDSADNQDLSGEYFQDTLDDEESTETYVEETPPPGQPGEGEGEPAEPPPPAEGEPVEAPPVEAEAPQNVPTPSEMSDFDYMNYCLIADDEKEVLKYLPLFGDPSKEETLLAAMSWRADIIKTVNAIRIRKKIKKDLSLSMEDNCKLENQILLTHTTLDLTPQPGEAFNINNADPVSTMRNLRFLDLSGNMLFRLGFLVFLDKLEDLRLDKNYFSALGKPYDIYHPTKGVGLKSLMHLGISYQETMPVEGAGDSGLSIKYPDVDLDGIKNLKVNLIKVTTGGNLIDPKAFRGLNKKLTVTVPSVLKFPKPKEKPKFSDACHKGSSTSAYPTQIDEYRKDVCGLDD